LLKRHDVGERESELGADFTSLICLVSSSLPDYHVLASQGQRRYCAGLPLPHTPHTWQVVGGNDVFIPEGKQRRVLNNTRVDSFKGAAYGLTVKAFEFKLV
jgi:hypothetical protein